MKYTKPTTQPQVLANALQAAENAHEAMDGSMGSAKSTAWSHVARAWAACASEMPIPPLFVDQEQKEDGDTVTLTREEYRALRTMAAVMLIRDRANQMAVGGDVEPTELSADLVDRLNGHEIIITRRKNGPWLVELGDNVE